MEPLIPPQVSAPSQAQVSVEPQPIQPIQAVQPASSPAVNQIPVQPAAPIPYIVPGMPVAAPVTQVTFPIQVQAAPQQFSPISPATPPKSRLKKILLILVILSLTSGAAYGMYVYKDTIKAMLPSFGDDVVLTEDNFTSSLMNSFKSINAAEYTFSANIFIKDREKDTVSMDSKLGPAPEKVASYKNDYNRAQIVSSLSSLLKYSTYSYSSGKTVPKFPKDMAELMKLYSEKNGKYSSAEDKASAVQIINSSVTYKPTNDGNDFELKTTFETDEAIDALKKTNTSFGRTSVADSATEFNGKSIILTKNSSVNFYLPVEMKRPFLSELGYYLKDLPQEFSIAGTSTILSKLVDGQPPEMKTGISAEGNFSDLTYKLSLDTILKDKMFYYHINNFPALGLLGGLATLKGKWVKVDISEKATTSNRYNPDMVGQLSVGAQEGLEKNKENTKKLMKAFTKAADATKLISFTSPPTHEKLGNENVTKYQFFIKKEQIEPFLQAITQDQEFILDQELYSAFVNNYVNTIETMLQSPDFDEVYNYSKANIFLTVWTRKDGMLIQAQMRVRIIPSVESKNLKDKQIELITTMMLSKINETITIDTPKDAKTYTEIMGTSSERGYW